MKRVLVLMVLSALALLILGGCTPPGSISESNIRGNACKAGDNCGVFMTITSTAKEPDVLLSARTDVAERTELHTMVNMKMTQVENIPVPAGGTVELKPGSLHVMLFTLKKELKAGDTFSLTLKYQKAGERTVQVKVQPPN